MFRATKFRVTWVLVVGALAIAVFWGRSDEAWARQGVPSQSTLAEMGLADLVPMSESESVLVRGAGQPGAYAAGFSWARVAGAGSHDEASAKGRYHANAEHESHAERIVEYQRPIEHHAGYGGDGYGGGRGNGYGGQSGKGGHGYQPKHGKVVHHGSRPKYGHDVRHDVRHNVGHGTRHGYGHGGHSPSRGYGGRHKVKSIRVRAGGWSTASTR